MGQVQSTKNLNQSLLEWKEIGSKQDLKQSYQNFTINYFSYGQIKLYENLENQEQMAASSKIFQNYFEYSKYLKKVKQIQSLNEINGLVKLLEIKEQIEENLCSNFYKLTTFFEYHENTLQKEIQLRSQVYNRKEIISFLQQIIGTLIELQNKQLVHGDLRPAHILVLTTQYKIKLPEIDQFRKMIINFDANYCYLTPDQVQAVSLRQVKYNTQLNPDIFSLGLVAVQMGTLKNIQDIYNLQMINQDILHEFQELQGEELAKLIGMMLQAPTNLNQVYDSLMVGDEKFYLCSQSPQKENTRYSAKSQKKGFSPIGNKIQSDLQIKKNWGQEFLQDSEIYVPLNPGDNYLNEQPTVALVKFNCSILDQPKQEVLETQQLQLKDVTNLNPKSTEKKSKSVQKNVSTQKLKSSCSFKFKRTSPYNNKFNKKQGAK